MEKPIFKKKNRIFTLRRVMWIMGGILTAFCVLLLLLPLAGEWAAENWLRNHGATQAQIDDIDFNPFSGRFVLRGLQAGTTGGKQFKIGSFEADLDWWPLLRKRIYIKQIQLEGATVDVSNTQDGVWQLGEVLISATTGDDAAQVTGANGSDKSTSKNPWSFGVNLIQVQASRFIYHNEPEPVDNELSINKLAVNQMVSWEPDSPTVIDASLKLDGSDFSFSGDATPFAQRPRFTGAVHLRQLDLQHYGPLIKDTVLKMQGKLSADMKINAMVQPREKNQVEAKGSLTLNDFVFELKNLAVQQRKLNWNGVSIFQAPASEQQPILSVNGRLDVDQSSVTMQAPNLKMSQKSITWSGEASYVASQAAQQSQINLNMKADSSLRGIRVVDVEKNLLLADIDLVSFKNINTSTLQQLSLDRLTVNNARFLQEAAQSELQDSVAGEGFGTLAELTADTLTVANLQHVHAGNVRLTGLGADITREKDGRLRWLSRLSGDSQPHVETAVTKGNTQDAPVSDTIRAEEKMEDEKTNDDDTVNGNTSKQKQEAANSWQFSLARLDIDGDSWVKYTDNTVEPVYSTLVKPLAISIRDINSADIQQASPMELTANMGEYTSVTASGKIYPFAQKPTADLKFQVTAFDVPQLSAYVPSYDIQRGRLYATVVLKLEQGKLDVQNNIRLSKLKMIAKTQGETGLVEHGLTMPLDTALDLLRNKKDQIVLRIPVSGDIEQPEFNLQDIINKATAKALQKAALAYVKHALQPLGTVLLVAGVAGKLAKPRFKPLLFNAGETTLNRRAIAYLDKIAGLLRDRPRINLTLCGVATPKDKKILAERALKAAQSKSEIKQQKPAAAKTLPEATTSKNHSQELLSLAQQRGDAVKKYLTENKHIKAERLYACKPTVSDNKKSSPRVEITL